MVSRGEDLYLKMLLLDNLMHADLHPGNILLRRARRYGRNSLALLDVGMVARLTRREASHAPSHAPSHAHTASRPQHLDHTASRPQHLDRSI